MALGNRARGQEQQQLHGASKSWAACAKTLPWGFKAPPPLTERKWQPTPVLLPGKSHGWRSLVGYYPWGHKEWDTTKRLHSPPLNRTWHLCKTGPEPLGRLPPGFQSPAVSPSPPTLMHGFGMWGALVSHSSMKTFLPNIPECLQPHKQDDELSTPQFHLQEHSFHWVRLNQEKADIMLQRLNAKFTVQGLPPRSSG